VYKEYGEKPCSVADEGIGLNANGNERCRAFDVLCPELLWMNGRETGRLLNSL